MSDFKDILFKVSDDGLIATISINRPKKFNAVSFELLAEIEKCILEKINVFSSRVRVVILTAEGKHFTSGIDINSAASIGTISDDINSDDQGAQSDSSPDDIARKAIQINDLVLRLQRWTSSLEICRVPVICAISGYCIGAGIDLSSACDIRICSQDTKFTIKEVDIGICADLGTIQRFQKVVGNDSWTRELAYTGRFFDANEAF